MKLKQIILPVVAIVTVGIAYVSYSHSAVKNEPSLLMQNIDALTDGESDGGISVSDCYSSGNGAGGWYHECNGLTTTSTIFPCETEHYFQQGLGGTCYGG